MRRAGIEFTGVGFIQPADVAGKFYAGGLHAQADAEVGDLVFTGIANSVQHAFNAALAKAARNQNAVKTCQLNLIIAVGGVFGLQPLGFYPGDVEFQVVGDGSVYQCFFQ